MNLVVKKNYLRVRWELSASEQIMQSFAVGCAAVFLGARSVCGYDSIKERVIYSFLKVTFD